MKKLEQEIDKQQIRLVETNPQMIILKRGEVGEFKIKFKNCSVFDQKCET